MSVLNYVVTSIHINLLVRDIGELNVITQSIQLVAGSTGHEFSQRKGRKGAYWEDRYHAKAVETNAHLIQCLVYIDLNMVRAGVVAHPSGWELCGYNEIRKSRQRYALIDYEGLKELLGFEKINDLSNAYQGWIDRSLKITSHCRDGKWTESIAVGRETFVTATKVNLGFKVKGRQIVRGDGSYELREPYVSYNGISGQENAVLKSQNGYTWKVLDV